MSNLKVYYAPHYCGKVLEPAYGGDAGFDLYYSGVNNIIVNPGEVFKIPTGICVAICSRFYGMVLEKSGLGIKYGTTLHGRVIDSGYRGEIICIMSTLKEWTIRPGDKIAQLVINDYRGDVQTVQCIEDLGETERGEKGFGSSGKA